ncbi:HyaD/HybD family hydrogenase maturation endopeptidase [Paramagnetospirillum kuznetsovii]|uniref:Hydrogenase expression/formation protein HupD n=1 Tax=Paramagnetospirillum kuznetsovii TaxID=2053833 RepID=A0A364NUT1_9PROT|nr:HyaD/HybD family hydrogenase maturation endopeptidase [Paramagnetospirillum kuznetsovii]RAU20665.1 HyaD/HybD family hydrogenase maturation endopeptidase [Paramagnetospirillum kuznetsovii]
MRVVILGVGNILLTDEGVGVYAVNELLARYDLPEEVEVIDGGTSGMDCLDQVSGADHLLIADAMRAKKDPGTITRLSGDQIPAFFKTKISPHQVGISDMLAALNFHGLMPANIVLFGIEPQSFATAMELSPGIAAILPQVVDMIVAELKTLGLSVRPKAA